MGLDAKACFLGSRPLHVRVVAPPWKAERISPQAAYGLLEMSHNLSIPVYIGFRAV